jgi:hypothetical protein
MNAEERRRKLIDAIDEAVKQAFEKYITPYYEARLKALETRPPEEPVLYRKSLTEMS